MRRNWPSGCSPSPRSRPLGLGARDSLRLEAGLCLYGHDIDETTTPIEADLGWTIGKRRRAEGGFPGAGVIVRQLAEGAGRKRVGIRPDGRAPAREGTPILNQAGAAIGRVTSGGFGPSVGAPIAMGYVAAADAGEGTPLLLDRARYRAPRACRPPAVCAAPLPPRLTGGLQWKYRKTTRHSRESGTQARTLPASLDPRLRGGDGYESDARREERGKILSIEGTRR